MATLPHGVAYAQVLAPRRHVRCGIVGEAEIHDWFDLADIRHDAHAQHESDEELHDSTNLLVWTLGYLTDRFPETAQALREGPAGMACFVAKSAMGGAGFEPA